MRLTLRTLLAYLDNILEPSAAQQLQAKIEESQTAADLVHRIRDVTKKVRLAAPAVDGKGMGLDANTVAEYLDNTLTSESTPDFEMVCLESDVHLAEVAACHEILSLVLVQSAEIDPATRQKMYSLLNQPAPQPAKIPTATTAPVAPVAMAVPQTASLATAGVDGKAKREVPAYLKTSVDEAAMARRGWMLAAVALLALILVGTTFALAAIPLESLPEFLRPLANSIFPREVVVVENVKPIPPKASIPEVPVPIVPVPVPTAMATVAPPPPGAATGTTTQVATAVATPTGLLQPPSALTPSAGVPPVAAATAPLPPTPAGAGTTVVAAPPLPVPPVPSSSLPAATATATAAPVAVATAVNNAFTAPLSSGPTPSGTATPPAVAVVPAAPAKIEPVGRVSSAGSQVLLRFDNASGSWRRLPARETLLVGDRLLALPTYRPQIALANGLTLDLIGGTLVELRPIDAAGTPGLAVLRGRLMVFNIGGTKSSLRLENGKSPTTIALTTAELGMEYSPRRAAGENPATAVSGGLFLYAKSGQIGSTSLAQPEAPLTAPGQWLLTDDGPPAALPVPTALPLWLTGDDRDVVEKQASDFVELGLRSDKAVSVALREMTSDRRIENVQLALRCLAQIGEFDDFIPPLRDPTQRLAVWERYVQMLADALDYGPVYAAKVHDALLRQHGGTAEDLYRMLWGYSDDQLKNGSAQYLVEVLDHDDLVFRIFAIWTLCDVTGQPTGGYLPQDQPVKRKPNILKWEQKLRDGQIAHKKS